MKDIIRKACAARVGVVLKTGNVDETKRNFYKARKELAEEGFTEARYLSCCTSPDNAAGELWLVKKVVPDAA